MDSQTVKIIAAAAILGCLMLALAVFAWVRRSMLRSRTKFSEEAARAISFARVEAEHLESPTIEPVHILLGLLHVPSALLLRLIPAEEHEAIRREIAEHVGGGAIVSYRDDLPFSEDSRAVLVAAAREARGFSSPVITAEHLLLGLLHSDNVAALILRERGLRLEPVRAQIGGWQP
jgi:ATP-dependent Clp protease ATP-binding subunit ClpA